MLRRHRTLSPRLLLETVDLLSSYVVNKHWLEQGIVHPKVIVAKGSFPLWAGTALVAKVLLLAFLFLRLNDSVFCAPARRPMETI